MKKLINTIVFGNSTLFSGLIAMAVVASFVLGCNCGKNLGLSNTSSDDPTNRTSSNTNDNKSAPADNSVPSDAKLQALVKDTTAQFADGIDTGEFSELYNKSSSDFQSTYTLQQTKDVFKAYIARKSRILPSLRSTSTTTAVFSPAPSVRTEKGLSILTVNGKFPTKPLVVKFEYEYVQRGGEWKMLKIKI